jgi:hypothetical protein
MAKFCHFYEMAKFCHLEIANMIFTDSYVEGCHFSKMAKFCHLREMAMAVETHTPFVTQMLARLLLAGALSYLQKICLDTGIF